MNKDFIQNALNNGEDGEQWLKRIPETIREYEKRWSIQVASPFDLNYNYVAPAIRRDGSQVVLKIGFPKDREFQTEIEALSVFNGEGVEKLLELDKENAVILIERVTPGVPLSSLDNDDEATRILADVMKKLWKPLPPNNTFIPISERVNAISDYKKKYRGRNNPIPSYLIDKADEMLKELIATSSEPVLVHGDLHHDNVLSSERDEWLAIDPKGVAAEKEHETAAMIRNPYEKMKKQTNLPKIIKRRIQILSEELQFDPKRVWKWCFAQTVLSGVWNIGTTKGPDHAIIVAEALDTLKI